MRKILRYLIGVIAAAVAQQAHSASITGNDLYNSCTSDEPIFKGECVGLMYGFNRGMNVGYNSGQIVTVGSFFRIMKKPLTEEAFEQKVGEVAQELRSIGAESANCVPDGATTEQLIDVTVKWLRNNPELRARSMEFVINKSFTDAFGSTCKK